MIFCSIKRNKLKDKQHCKDENLLHNLRRSFHLIKNFFDNRDHGAGYEGHTETNTSSA